jgi:hypothetical protein
VERPKAVFGIPSVWDSTFETHESIFRAIEDLKTIARDLVAATKDSSNEVVQVQRALTQICSESMFDVLMLAGNQRGTGAMKIARGMFEISVISAYLEKNPAEVHDYLDFSTVEAWRHLQTVEKYSPSRVPLELMSQAQAEYDRVKHRFTNAKGKVQHRWADKSIKQMAEDVGLLNIYEVAYSTASELHHLPFTGVIRHELNWLYYRHSLQCSPRDGNCFSRQVEYGDCQIQLFAQEVVSRSEHLVNDFSFFLEIGSIRRAMRFNVLSAPEIPSWQNPWSESGRFYRPASPRPGTISSGSVDCFFNDMIFARRLAISIASKRSASPT